MNYGNLTQIQRYKQLLNFIDKNFKEDINIEKIEKISLYSYRNINRIFQSLHHETIGKYVKRLRLEKAAEYIKYSDRQISDVAIDVGFSDVAAFSKAFKKRFNCSPLSFKRSVNQLDEFKRQSLKTTKQTKVNFEIEVLPEFEILYLEHRGDYHNLDAIDGTWDLLLKYGAQHNLISDETIFLSETLDDAEISDHINCRINVAITLDEPISFEPAGLFHRKIHKQQKYAKFMHTGKIDQLIETYDWIYNSWLTSIQLDFVDKPTLEFYVNHDDQTPQEEWITEIYIPVE